MAPAASVIIRAKDKAETIGAAMASIRAQSVQAEIVVVDSGSRDGTLDLAHRLADRVIEIPPESFTYGRALNVGAAAASAPVHFALSAHCVAPHPRWIERALEHYRRSDVAGAGGRRLAVGGRDLHEPLVQDLAHARADPGWGFSNHASSWRAAVWAEFPFDEELRYAEDKEWALRVLNAGWVLVFDAELFVDMSHQWRQGFFQYYRRQRDAAAALASFAEVPPFGLGQLVGEWWAGPPDPRPPWRRRLNPQRAAGLLGRWQGQRRARSA